MSENRQDTSLEVVITDILMSHASKRISDELGDKALLHYQGLHDTIHKAAYSAVEKTVEFIGSCVSRIQ